MSAHKLMAWLSPAYPVGAFSYSHGLEAAIASGEVQNASDLQAWLDDVLRFGAGRNDAILLAAAYRAKSDELSEIADLAQALSASAERHLEATAQGAAFARTTSAVMGKELEAMPLPVAIGAAARAEGIALEEVLPLAIHAFAANIIAAAVRFVPLGQTDGQKVLAALFPHYDALAQEATASDLDDLGGCAILSDIAAMQHETMTTRIFRS